MKTVDVRATLKGEPYHCSIDVDLHWGSQLMVHALLDQLWMKIHGRRTEFAIWDYTEGAALRRPHWRGGEALRATRMGFTSLKIVVRGEVRVVI